MIYCNSVGGSRGSEAEQVSDRWWIASWGRRHRSELPGQEVDASSLGRQTSGEEQQVFWLSEVKEVAFTLRVDVTSLVSGLTVAQWLREEQAKVQRQDSNSDSKTRSWPVPSKINVITRMRSTL